MKKLQLTALVVAFSLCSVPLFSCSDDDSKTPSISLVDPSENSQTENENTDENTDENVSESKSDDSTNRHSSGSHKNDSSFGEEAEVNETIFTLDSVVRVPDEISGKDYIYIGVTIKNSTDTEYTISSLNNFFLDIGNGQELASDVRTKQLALSEFPKCVNDPVTIPANGEFSGYLAGGFAVPTDTQAMSVGFFPTLDNDTNKSEFISTPISADNISDDVSLLK